MEINKTYITQKNTYTGKNQPKYIIIHETDNYAVGAGAERHAQAQAAGNLGTSVHYYCGSDGVYQTAAHTDGTYSIGIEYGGNHVIKDADNRNTINIEICVNQDGDYQKAWENAILLVKYLIQMTAIPIEWVIRHYDAKGKYCPRKMLDRPDLWEEFKLQLGQIVNKDEVDKLEEEIWYRVGSAWQNGICQNQTGAYRVKAYAIADCKSNQNVYDESGNVIYAGESKKDTVVPENLYTQDRFIRDVQKYTNSRVDGYAGDKTLSNTVTVSRTKNKTHAVVTALERRLKQLGYYAGEIEEDGGKTPYFGAGMENAVNMYQKNVLKYAKVDGEVTKGKKMWKSLLGMV